MIDKFTLKNFQIHKDKVIKFTDGINVIVGSTDSGKSAIYRALKYVCLNDLKGVGFVTHNQKKPCSLTIDGDFGTLNRSRGKTANTYNINGTELKAFGQGSVSDVLKVTNITEINFQSQHDKPFLLDETPGNVAKYLNKLINLEVIDTTLSNLKSVESEATRKVKQYQETVSEKEEQIEKFEDLKDANSLLEHIEEVETKVEALPDTEELSRLVDKLGDSLDALDTIEEVSEDRFAPLTKLADEINASEAREDELCDLLEPLKDIVQIEVPNIDKMLEMIETIKDLDKQIEDIDDILGMFPEEEDFDGEIAEVKAELEELSPTCPLCGKGWAK